MLTKEDEAVMAYRREGYTGRKEGSEEKAALVIVLNFTPQEAKWNLADGRFEPEHANDPQVLLGNYRGKLDIRDGVLTLRPFEAAVFRGDGNHSDIDPGKVNCSIC